jgi:hypothetical protein
MIDDYQFGQITINGQIYDHDIYINSSGQIKPWWRKESHLIEKEDIKEVFSEKPDFIVIGTGAYSVAKVSKEIEKLAKENKIELFIDSTGEAVKKYNELKNKNYKVAAFFHLTC